MMTAITNQPAICILSPNQDAYSETFIRAHIERIPAQVQTLYGWPPINNGQELVSQFPSLIQHAKRAIVRRLGHLTFEEAITRKLTQYFKQTQISAVLAEYGVSGVRVMEACRQANVPLVVHFHGYDAYNQTVLDDTGRHYPLLFQTAASIVAVSRDMERQLLGLGAPRERVYYNPYGIDISLFQGANPGQAKPIFVAVGRFVDKKAPHLTLLAFKKVSELCPDSRLIMIGDGPLWEACKQLAKAWGVDGSVEFRGSCSHVEVASVMQQSRAFVQHSVHTSYGDSEGTPVAILEAGASGLPVIATRHAGIEDIVIDRETGLLVDEGDVDAMASHMIRLATDPPLARLLGVAAHERIATGFSMEKHIERLWAIIEGSIQRSDRSRQR